MLPAGGWLRAFPASSEGSLVEASVTKRAQSQAMTTASCTTPGPTTWPTFSMYGCRPSEKVDQISGGQINVTGNIGLPYQYDTDLPLWRMSHPLQEKTFSIAKTLRHAHDRTNAHTKLKQTRVSVDRTPSVHTHIGLDDGCCSIHGWNMSKKTSHVKAQ